MQQALIWGQKPVLLSVKHRTKVSSWRQA